MALISKIRNNSWIIVVLLALGLGGFIIMDMTSGQQSVFGSDATTLAKIDGRKLSINEFTRVEQILYGGGGGNTFSQRDYLWGYFIDETLVNSEAEKLGLGVSKKELRELEFGQNLSPIIESRFRNNQNFQVDRERLNSFRDAIDNNQLTDQNIRNYWAHQEKEIIVDRLKTKLSTLISKAMYAPNWLVEMANKEQNTQIDFAYVQIPYAEIENSEIALENSDFTNYLQNNKGLYYQKEQTRRLDYVVFDVKATQQDIDSIYAKITRLAIEFQNADNDTLFLENNYSNFDPTFYKKDQVDATIADTLFKLPVGAVYGPYKQDETYKIAKIMAKKIIPDSVRSRHILLPAQDQQGYFDAKRVVDSLKNLVETGVEPFDSLAAKFGTDGTRLKGGDLGYAAPGQMVPEYNNLIFFDGKPDTLYVIGTQFGVHLVEITGRKYINNEQGLQIGYVDEPIIPSEGTQDRLYREALKFAADNRKLANLKEAVNQKEGLKIESSLPLTKNSYSVGTLGATQASRDMVKWAFASSTSLNEVSADVYVYQDEVNFYNNKYVVVALKSIQQPGLPAVNDIREEIESQVINLKKAALIKETIKGKSIEEAANQYKVEVDTAASVTFSASFIPGLGNEPKVVAKAFGLKQGETSTPIEGNNGVYIIKILIKPENIAPANAPLVRQGLDRGLKAQIGSGLSNVLKDNARITDNRAKFY
jgi:peptidyl-prolyl cis-trans isomerase D